MADKPSGEIDCRRPLSHALTCYIMFGSGLPVTLKDLMLVRSQVPGYLVKHNGVLRLSQSTHEDVWPCVIEENLELHTELSRRQRHVSAF